MSIELLKISGFQDSSFKTPTSSEPYTVIINPDQLHWNRVLSKPGESVESISMVNLSFDLIIDCTGIVDATRTNLSNEINQLERNLYYIQEGSHIPIYVKVSWGKNLLFYSKLISCDVSYTLFKPDGSPLRAKVSLVFGEQ